jgi:uncharacterized membrane protein
MAANCFISPVKALNVDYYGIENRIQEDTTVLSVVTLTFNSSLPELQYRIKYRVSNVQAQSEFAPVDCKTQVTDTTLITCTFASHENYAETKLKLAFSTNEIIKMVDENHELGYFVPMEENAKRFFNIVYLPPTATLATEMPNESFSPRDGTTLSDGRHIMVYWERLNLEKGEDIYFSISYKMPPSQNGNIIDIALTVIIAVIIIASLGIFYVRTSRRQDSMKVMMPLMKGDEKVVIDILSKHGGSVNQKVIVRESDFSKAKVSRIIADLKERNIVSVESMGRMNKITLKLRG